MLSDYITSIYWINKQLYGGGSCWKTLSHNGPLFPPSYDPLPTSVKVFHKGSELKLDKTDTKNPFHVTPPSLEIKTSTLSSDPSVPGLVVGHVKIPKSNSI